MKKNFGRKYLIGANVRSDATGTFHELESLFQDCLIDHIQVQLVPEPEALFSKRLSPMENGECPIIVHAPWHTHGVNPCAPTAYSTRSPSEGRQLIESGMQLSFEAADRLDADMIILHAGEYEPGRFHEAVDEFLRFLEHYRDPRLTLENLPAVFRGHPMLGASAGEMALLAGSRGTGICLDFAHLYAAAIARRTPYAEELARFGELPVTHYHLSNTMRDSEKDLHLPLDDPAGGIDLNLVCKAIRRHPALHTTLEYKGGSGFYRRQLAFFDAVFTASEKKNSGEECGDDPA